jgi:UDP-GlcNAc:undecaprenyl-phosphate GlcNAc-1-phosphate transferase
MAAPAAFVLASERGEAIRVIARAGREGDSGPDADVRPRVTVAGIAAAVAVAAAVQGPWAGLAVAAACAATRLLVPVAVAVALRHGATALPGGRSVHSHATPALGGLAVAVPLLAALIGAGDVRSWSLALGCALVGASGAMDDLRGLSPIRKLLVQSLAAGVLHVGGFRVGVVLCAPFAVTVPEAMQPLLLLFWVLLVTNAVNLVDGIDGLASGVGLLACLGCAVLGYGGFAPLVLSGALLGFMRHNLPPARIFLGDGGSLTIGFAIAAILADTEEGFAIPAAVGLLALPLGDVALCVARRALRGKPIFGADRGHVHHRVLRLCGAAGPALAILLAFAALQVLLAVLRPDTFGLVASGLVWAAFGVGLLGGTWAPLRRVLRSRRNFRRLHLLKQYAERCLRLAESADDVESILRRVAEDLDLASLHLRHVCIVRAAPGGPVVTLPCGSTRASWTLTGADADGTLADERRAVLCDLLRGADATLRRLVENAPVARLPAVHFVACGIDDLLRVTPLVTAARRNGEICPVVVHTGRRDALPLRDIRGATEPDIDLDIEEEDDTSRARERYDALLEVVHPAFAVVVGETGPAAACASAARRKGIPVAHVPLPAHGELEPVAEGLIGAEPA